MPLKIAVCMKQVPNVARVRFDPETRRIVREGVPGLMDTFENRALGYAVAYRTEHGAHVTAVTMGPPQAREILEQGIATGADNAIHLCDRAFAGSDTLATSRALALALRPHDFDLVLCGRHSTDSETGQVGPEVAELLGLPHLSGVRRLAVDEDARMLQVEQQTDDGIDVLGCPLPALVTVSEEIGEEVWPQPSALEAVDPAAIRTLGAPDLAEDLSLFGADGSPTRVGEVYSEQSNRLGVVLSDDEPVVLAEQLVEALIERGSFDATGTAALMATRRPADRGRSVWVWAEHRDGLPRAASLELLGAAAAIAEAIGGHTAAIVAGGGKGLAHTLAAHGADEVLTVRESGPDAYGLEHHVATLSGAINAEKPYAVLFIAGGEGRDLAPRVAARLGLGLTGDCIGLRVDGDGNLVQLKPAFGGNIVAPVYSRTWPQMATVRPGLLHVPSPLADAPVNQRPLPTIRAVKPRIHFIESLPDVMSDVSGLMQARIVVGVGRGIGGPEGLPVVRRLADSLRAEIGATRVVTDLGWLPRQRQVGLTGRAISPALYIVVGVSGSFNHMVGVLKAGTTVAINRSPRAAIAKVVDFTLIGDWAELVPALTNAITRAKTRGRLQL